MAIPSVTLKELNLQVQQLLKQELSAPVWVRAEISELRDNSNGHCYLELIEKEDKSDRITARSKATIWNGTYRMLKPYFKNATGMELTAGMKIMVLVTVEFHELYGMNLNIRDIDPTYTVGDMAMRKAEILKQLDEEGILDMNGELPLAMLPQRIAVISSATAAGYGDFCDQLTKNSAGYPFYIKLFPASMQGAQTEDSIIAALDAIYRYVDLFDCVVIIRGGGATADLSAFDSYLLAVHVAQFPLPVIAGIGHLRDESVVDIVAHSSVKTPTAAAELLIDQCEAFDQHLANLSQQLLQSVQNRLGDQSQLLRNMTIQLPAILTSRTGQEVRRMDQLINRLKRGSENALNEQWRRLELQERDVKHNDPMNLLQKGYTLTECEGRVVTSTTQLHKGATLVTHFVDGRVQSTIDHIINNRKNNKKK